MPFELIKELRHRWNGTETVLGKLTERVAAIEAELELLRMVNLELRRLVQQERGR